MRIKGFVSSSDKRVAQISANGLRVALVVFVAGDIPPAQYHQLINGFKSLKSAREYCADNGFAWFKTAQG
jgi:hypothetical protein